MACASAGRSVVVQAADGATGVRVSTRQRQNDGRRFIGSGGSGSSVSGSTQQQQRKAERQVSFTQPFPAVGGRVAIIGGGLSGLSCAQQLAARGIESCVFDTGEHGVGGRLATRASADGSLPEHALKHLVFDHAAQFFTVNDPRFAQHVERWQAAGAVERWSGPVGSLCGDGEYKPVPGNDRYIAAGGMRSLAEHLAAEALATGLVEVRRPLWISSARFDRRGGGEGWRLVGRGQDQGALFDALVIAHNGKCANRLAQGIGAPLIHAQLRRLKLSANWVLMAAFERPLGLPWEGAFVRGSEELAWAANNSAKLRGSGGGGPECWTLVSTRRYGKANKVPQEAVPPEVAQRVTAELLAAFARSLGRPRGSLPPLAYSRVQLWGAALPQNSPDVPCILDPASRVGVCGDWLLGSSMEAAVLSGVVLADQLSLLAGQAPEVAAGLAVGLHAPFRRIQGEEMGQFPGASAAAPPGARAPSKPLAAQ